MGPDCIGCSAKKVRAAFPRPCPGLPAVICQPRRRETARCSKAPLNSPVVFPRGKARLTFGRPTAWKAQSKQSDFWFRIGSEKRYRTKFAIGVNGRETQGEQRGGRRGSHQAFFPIQVRKAGIFCSTGNSTNAIRTPDAPCTTLNGTPAVAAIADAAQLLPEAIPRPIS